MKSLIKQRHRSESLGGDDLDKSSFPDTLSIVVAIILVLAIALWSYIQGVDNRRRQESEIQRQAVLQEINKVENKLDCLNNAQ